MLQTNRLHIRDAAAEIDLSESIILRAAANSDIILYAQVTRCPVKEQLEPWSGEIQLTAVQAGTLAVSPSALVILTKIETEAGVLHPIDAPLNEQRAIINRNHVLVDLDRLRASVDEPELSDQQLAAHYRTSGRLLEQLVKTTKATRFVQGDGKPNFSRIAEAITDDQISGQSFESIRKRLAVYWSHRS